MEVLRHSGISVTMNTHAHVLPMLHEAPRQLRPGGSKGEPRRRTARPARSLTGDLPSHGRAEDDLLILMAAWLSLVVAGSGAVLAAAPGGPSQPVPGAGLWRVGYGSVMEPGRLQITFDCLDPARVGMFWAAALAYPVPDVGGWHNFLRSQGRSGEDLNATFAIEDPAGVRPRMFFQRVPEGNRRV